MAKKRSYERDRAGMGPEPHTSRRLLSLDDLKGYDIADGEPDIRGWDVCTVNGRELGEVEDLLVDPDRGEVVMLDVELRDGGVHAEVPIRSVQLDRDRKVVLLDSAEVDRNIRYDDEAFDRLSEEERERIRSDARYQERMQSRLTEDERQRLRDEYRDTRRSVRYGELDRTSERTAATGAADSDEVVVERRPVIEEVVIRRRPVDEE